ncbi:hypothetical protein HHI36_002275 [Cryptolaemus montrouzieri]|uniref:Uncharacterized protein n=1 Tax=Cryptolaemus montrouzieri TaxID=559131 RepID=A0ABD2PAM6_9CUCU
MLGILKERMGIIPGAAECFKKALNLSTARYSDLARINCGRVLTKLGLYKVAIKICSDVQESSFHSGIWYALALYKDGQFQESSSIYLAIAQRLAKDKCSIGDVIACMAIITYVGGEPELAKTIIIESFNERLPTARVIYALIALGVLEKDTQMVALALKQIDIVDDVPKSIEDFITLLSYVHIYQGNHIKAIRKASELVHLLPDKSGLWLTFALTLLRSLKYSKSSAFSASAVNKAAKVALELRDDKATHRDISKIHCTISSSSSLIQDHRSALISAQKAVHCTPDAKECWLVLNESLEFYSDKYVAAKVAAQVLSSPYEEYQHIRFNSIF